MKGVRVLALAALAVVAIAWLAMPAEGIRSYQSRISRALADEEFERYAVRVNRAAESTFGGPSRRGRTARGRMMQQIGCDSGKTLCGTTCTNTTENPQNCGACGAPCGASEACCGGVCTDVAFSAQHCGQCYSACAEGACAAGLCGYGS